MQPTRLCDAFTSFYQPQSYAAAQALTQDSVKAHLHAQAQAQAQAQAAYAQSQQQALQMQLYQQQQQQLQQFQHPHSQQGMPAATASSMASAAQVPQTHMYAPFTSTGIHGDFGGFGGMTGTLPPSSTSLHPFAYTSTMPSLPHDAAALSSPRSLSGKRSHHRRRGGKKWCALPRRHVPTSDSTYSDDGVGDGMCGSDSDGGGGDDDDSNGDGDGGGGNVYDDMDDYDGFLHAGRGADGGDHDDYAGARARHASDDNSDAALLRDLYRRQGELIVARARAARARNRLQRARNPAGAWRQTMTTNREGLHRCPHSLPSAPDSMAAPSFVRVLAYAALGTLTLATFILVVVLLVKADAASRTGPSGSNADDFARFVVQNMLAHGVSPPRAGRGLPRDVSSQNSARA